MSIRVLERFQQEWNARERLRCGEELGLQFGLLSGEGGAGDRQLGPGMEDFGRVGTRAALQLGLDFPGKRRLAVLMQDYVVAFRIDILGIDEKSVHVKETGANFWEFRVCHNHDGGVGT